MNSHPYLINEYPLIVQPRLAVALGLPEAIILQQVHYWLGKSTNIREGRRWVYNSYPQWQTQFPFWPLISIKRYFQSLEKSGVLISDNFNTLGMDRTKWYTIDYDVLNEQIKLIPPSDQNDPTSGSKRSDDEVSLISPIPETTTETNSETPPDSLAPSKLGAARRREPEEIAKWRPVQFGQAWEFYGKVGSVVKAAEAWDKAKPTEEMDWVIGDAIEQQRTVYRWGLPDGRIQPDFSTWFNQQRWNDDPQARPNRGRR